jgi:septum site-determining protein MinC
VKNSIIIKSFQNGISLYLDPDASLDEILTELKDKFQQSEKFFRDSRVAITIEGRSLSLQEEKIITDTIMDNSSMVILCIVDKSESKNEVYANALRRLGLEENFSKCSLYEKTLKNGENLDAVKDLVIVGNVEDNASVKAGGSVYVLGSVQGSIKAGENHQNNSKIFILDNQAELLQISGIRYKKAKAKTLFSKKNKTALIFSIEDNRVIQSPFKLDGIGER